MEGLLNNEISASGGLIGLREPVDTNKFRQVMRKLAGSVTVITTENGGQLYGFTATAVCSVCAEPPTLLIVVNRSARTHPHIWRKGAFAVNVLADNQKDVAEHFASKGDCQFSAVAYSRMESGVPVIQGAAAYIECEVEQTYDVGTHTIFIGRIVETGAEEDTPLIYYDARYARASSL